LSFLEEFQDIFSLAEGERGETDLVEMNIDTKDFEHKKQAACQLPLAVRHGVALHMQKMLEQNVIHLSNSPLASPMILFCKKNGSL